ncbi:MAG: hypothetical protein D6706_06515 [Chloroflexi bacterium]|nr:MAG: hypothetical protein D6706_06515 [Chloroflexota bacterium]
MLERVRVWLSGYMEWLVGGAVGLLGMGVSGLGSGLVPGRVPADPLPLALLVGQLLRNRLYFNWWALVVPLLFAVLLGGMVGGVMGWAGVTDRRRVVRAARVAAVLNILMVAADEVDAPVVAFWYLVAGMMSVWVTTAVSTRFLFLPPKSPLPNEEKNLHD